MRALQGRVSVMALAPQNQLGETTQERGRAHPGAGAGGPRAWVLHPRGRPGRGSGLGSARSGLGDFSPAWQRRFALRGEGHSGPGQALRAPFMDFGQGRLQGDTLARTPAAGPPQAPPRPPRAGAGACRPSLAAGLGLRRVATRRRGGGAPPVTCPRTSPAHARPRAPAPPPPPGAIAVGVRSPVRTAWLCRGDPSALWQEGCGGGCGRGSGRREDIRSVKMEEQGMPERLAEVNSQNARLLLKLLEKDKEVRKLRRELEKKAQQDQLDLLCAQMESQLQLHEGWATPEPGAGSSVEGDRGSAPPAAAPAGGARRRSPLRRRPAGPAARQPRPRSEGRPPSLQGLMQVFKKFLEKPAAGSEPRMLRSGPSVSPRMHFSMKFSKAPLGCLNFHVLGFIDFFICGGSNLAAAYLRVSRVRPGPQDAAIPAPSSGAQGQGESCKSEPTPPEVAAAG